MQVSDNFGPIYQSVVLDGSGNGAVSFQATGSNIRLSNIFFRVETANSQAVCTIYKGQIAPGNIVLNSNSGSTGSNAQGNVDLFDGETCYVVWTGGDAGSTATATFSGGKIPFGEIKPSQLEAQDPIAAGDGSLVYPALKSPNYVAGVSGWKLDRDGDLEINDGIVRGVLHVDGDDGGYVEVNNYANFAGIEFMPEFPFAGEEPGRIYAYNEVSGNPWPVTTILSPSPTAGDVAQINLFGERQNGSLQPKIEMRADETAVTGTLTVAGEASVTGMLTGGVPYCRLAKNASQTIANNTIVDITFPSVIEDDRGWFNPAQPTRITPDLLGRYLVIGNLTFMANATGDRRAYIRKNGTNSGRWSRDYPSGAVQVQTDVVSVVNITTLGDYITIGALQSSGGNLDMSFGAGDGDTTFSCTFEVIYQGSVP